ncbi:unnamed protein product [Fraxinus pennsylvanica]|uniref:Uncharacterized protein n=1 Tax=Fraxinus pennsylvanica TaxID=56036 RepID=A0AAD1YT28_9LAMI|nr:unnamed protein product [Fraxinus pennsylvanica]
MLKGVEELPEAVKVTMCRRASCSDGQSWDAPKVIKTCECVYMPLMSPCTARRHENVSLCRLCLLLMVGKLFAGIEIGFRIMIAPVYVAEILPTILPSIFIGFALFVIPESPRWLVMQNRIDKARMVLLKTNEKASDVEERLIETQQPASFVNAAKYKERDIWRDLLNPSLGVQRMLITGCGI